MRDLLSVSGKVTRDHCNLTIPHPFLLNQPLDLMHDPADLSGRVGGLKKGNASCILPRINRICPITKQMLFHPGKLRSIKKSSVFLILQPDILLLAYLIFLCKFRQSYRHLSAHIKEILDSHFPVNVSFLICGHRYINLLGIYQKQFHQPILYRGKARISIQGDDAVFDQLRLRDQTAEYIQHLFCCNIMPFNIILKALLRQSKIL